MSAEERDSLADLLGEHLRRLMGWCPMTAPEQQPAQGVPPAEIRTQERRDGPVAGRAARFMYLTGGVVILSWVAALLILPALPAVIPVHWNLQGEADGYAGAIPGAFGLPVIITLVTILFILLPRFDCRYAGGFGRSRDMYAIILFATTLVLLGMEILLLLVAAGADLPLITIMPALIGFLFIVIGSLMPSVERNTTMGFRLPWTLASDRVWKRTHEHGGTVMMAAGILTVLGSLLAGPWSMVLMLVLLIGAVLYISVWSYRFAKTDTGGS